MSTAALERAKERKKDEEWVREFQALPRGNDMTADEMKKFIRGSRTSDLRPSLCNEV